MKISIAQLNYIIGDFEGNTSKIIDAMKTGVEQNADIICFGELSTCGYPPRDFLEFDDFIRRSEKAIDKIKMASLLGEAIIIELKKCLVLYRFARV